MKIWPMISLPTQGIQISLWTILVAPLSADFSAVFWVAARLHPNAIDG